MPREDWGQPVRIESSLSVWRQPGSLAFQKVRSKGSGQTEWMLRLIWVFAGHIGHFVGFVVLSSLLCKLDKRGVRGWLLNGHNYRFSQHQIVTKNLLHRELITVIFLSFRTDRSGQTVQTQIRLLLEEQSDQGLHCLPFRLHRLDSWLYDRAT